MFCLNFINLGINIAESIIKSSDLKHFKYINYID